MKEKKEERAPFIITNSSLTLSFPQLLFSFPAFPFLSHFLSLSLLVHSLLSSSFNYLPFLLFLFYSFHFLYFFLFPSFLFTSQDIFNCFPTFLFTILFSSILRLSFLFLISLVFYFPLSLFPFTSSTFLVSFFFTIRTFVTTFLFSFFFNYFLLSCASRSSLLSLFLSIFSLFSFISLISSL